MGLLSFRDGWYEKAGPYGPSGLICWHTQWDQWRMYEFDYSSRFPGIINSIDVYYASDHPVESWDDYRMINPPTPEPRPIQDEKTWYDDDDEKAHSVELSIELVQFL